jgi:FG-GAP-like repeat
MRLSRSRSACMAGVLAGTVLATSAILAPTASARMAPTVATAGAPSAPRITEIRPRSGGALVFWDPAAPNGSLVTSYRVSYGLPQTVTTSGSVTQAEITGLKNVAFDYGYYSITVTATNAFGTSPSSQTAWVGPTMTDARIIAGADFTGDGRNDIIGATGSTSRTDLVRPSYLYRGNGRGVFAGSAALNRAFLESDRHAFAAGDFDGKGAPDVLMVDNKWVMTLLPGNGSGGFRLGDRRVFVGTNWRFRLIFSPGDFTGDGKVDVLTVDSTQVGHLYLYRGNGRGGFAPRQQVGTNWIRYKHVFSPGDLSGDGNPDVMAISRADGALYLFRGNGRGGFVGPVLKFGHGWDNFLSVFSAGDFNGDRRPDVMAVTRAGDLLLYRGNGRGGFLAGAQKVGTNWNAFR